MKAATVGVVVGDTAGVADAVTIGVAVAEATGVAVGVGVSSTLPLVVTGI